MTITRADAADLRAGDVVELSGHRSLHSATVTGPVWTEADGSLCVGDWTLRRFNGDGPSAADQLTLTVISRAKPPLYVNSDKTEPDPGDVVRDADGDDSETWTYSPGPDRDRSYPWRCNTRRIGMHRPRLELPARLRLLVDGRTGQVVQ